MVTRAGDRGPSAGPGLLRSFGSLSLVRSSHPLAARTQWRELPESIFYVVAEAEVCPRSSINAQMSDLAETHASPTDQPVHSDLFVLTDLQGQVISDDGNPAYLAGALHEAKLALARHRAYEQFFRYRAVQSGRHAGVTCHDTRAQNDHAVSH